ncbi:MAG TPA: hypothetical protein VGK73_31505 [Polyangiaceae bacterium]
MTENLPESFASTDELLTAYWRAQERIRELEQAAREITSWDWSHLLIDHRDSEVVKIDVERLGLALDGVRIHEENAP